tara:strand:- start:28 stop:165 length:138 start_codon:yes stop_codon:yes gene_type:complete
MFTHSLFFRLLTESQIRGSILLAEEAPNSILKEKWKKNTKKMRIN